MARLAAPLRLRAIAFTYLAAILLGPLALVFYRTFENGFDARLGGALVAGDDQRLQADADHHRDRRAANTVFGIACALSIVRGKFRGKGFVNAFVDLPLALSPVVVGLSLVPALRPRRLVRLASATTVSRSSSRSRRW